MNLYLQFALRYFYKKNDKSFSSNAINLAIVGLAIGVFSLLMTISIINGFEEVLSNKIIRVDKPDEYNLIYFINYETFAVTKPRNSDTAWLFTKVQDL